MDEARKEAWRTVSPESLNALLESRSYRMEYATLGEFVRDTFGVSEKTFYRRISGWKNPRRKCSGLYFVRAGGFIKVGWTVDVDRRMNSMQVDNALVLSLVYFHKSNDKSLERESHDRLALHHYRGEWFRVHEDIFRMIGELKEQTQCLHTGS